MTFALRPSKVFLAQVGEYPAQERLLVARKLELAKLNPSRYKPLSVPGAHHGFRDKDYTSQLPVNFSHHVGVVPEL